MAPLRQGTEAPRRRARARNGACAQESVSQGLGSERGGLARAGAGQGTMADGLLAHATRASAEDLGLTVYLNHHHYIHQRTFRNQCTLWDASACLMHKIDKGAGEDLR